MVGTFLGVMIQALIGTYITFDGTLSSWWAKIATGAFCSSSSRSSRACPSWRNGPPAPAGLRPVRTSSSGPLPARALP